VRGRGGAPPSDATDTPLTLPTIGLYAYILCSVSGIGKDVDQLKFRGGRDICGKNFTENFIENFVNIVYRP